MQGARRWNRFYEPRPNGHGPRLDDGMGRRMELLGQDVHHSKSAGMRELGDRMHRKTGTGGNAICEGAEVAGGNYRFTRHGGNAGKLVSGAVEGEARDGSGEEYGILNAHGLPFSAAAKNLVAK